MLTNPPIHYDFANLLLIFVTSSSRYRTADDTHRISVNNRTGWQKTQTWAHYYVTKVSAICGGHMPTEFLPSVPCHFYTSLSQLWLFVQCLYKSCSCQLKMSPMSNMINTVNVIILILLSNVSYINWSKQDEISWSLRFKMSNFNNL